MINKIIELPTFIAYDGRAASKLDSARVMIRQGRYKDAIPLIWEARALIREKRVYG